MFNEKMSVSPYYLRKLDRFPIYISATSEQPLLVCLESFKVYTHYSVKLLDEAWLYML